MRRRFVVIGQKAVASDEFLLDDLPGTSGRLDILVRCLRASLLSSHGLRRNVITYLVLLGGPRAPRVVRVDGETAKFIRPDERALGGMMRKVLAMHDDDSVDGFALVKPGIAVARGGLDAVLADAPESDVFVLEEGAPDIRSIEIEPAGRDLLFFAGDHIGIPDAMRAELHTLGARPVSVGPVSIHADDAIAITTNELDRRGL